ncbi:MAG: 30S ribosomal protein S16 [Deltaproteobacteria bacterium]|nr:30S ribosomal protein S16 [Deltaproteobacteria bacterium]
MAACIRLTRCGMKNQPFFRIVVADDRRARDGKFIEVLGTYDPRKKENKTALQKDRFGYWKKNGVRMSRTVSELTKEL